MYGAIFFILIFVTNAISSGPKKEMLDSKTIGHYQVSVERNKSEMVQRFIIKKDKKVIYEEGEIGSYYWIGNHFDELSKKNNLYNVRDLTGNGTPDLVMTSWNGGAHCCNTLTIFEMKEKEIKKIVSIDGGSYGFTIEDIDNDGLVEIEFSDWPIDYLFNSFAHSAQGRVVLKVVDGQYRVAKELMYKNKPDGKNLLKLKKEIQKDFFNNHSELLPYSFLKLMMDLSYSGHKEFALEIADDIWPRNKVGLKKFKTEFSKALGESIYWSAFYKQ